jgi:TolA-binding protein
MKMTSSKNHSLVAAMIAIACWATSSGVFGQSNTRQPSKRDTPPRKLTAAEKIAHEVLSTYTDAANFQTNGAYPLAIEAWEKLLREHPNDALAGKARHYLGVCYLQIEKPDYDKASQTFREALKDPKLEIREETLVKLGQSLYDGGLQSEGESKRKKLAEAVKAFDAFLGDYPDGSYADQATFYAGEAEYQLGRFDKAANFYRRLVDQPSLAKSDLRPDALFALGILYEDQSQSKLATESYESFLKDYSKHRLIRDARLRLAELYLAGDRPNEAGELFAILSKSQDDQMLDYIYFRYGYALAKAGKFDESSDVYKMLGEKFPNSKYASGSMLAAGQTLMREKKYDEAATYFNRLLPMKNDSSSEAAHLLCRIAMLQGKPSEAVPIARDALNWSSKSPRYAELKMDLAEALTITPDGQAEAKKLFEQIAVDHEKEPLAARAAYSAAFAAWQSGDAAEAKQWAAKFAKKWPNDILAPDVAYIAAEASLQLGAYDDAVTAFEQLIQSQKENSSLESWELRLGHAYYLAEKFDELSRRMNELIQSAKSNDAKAEAHFLIGAGLSKQGKYADARSAFRSSIEASKSWTQADEAYWMLAQADLRDGDSDAARLSLDQLRKAFPKSRFADQAEFRMGQLAAASGDFKSALASYQRVLDSDRDKPLKDLAVYGKAWVLMQQSQYDDALKLLNSITSSSSADTHVGEAVLAKAICLRNLSQPKEAIAVLEEMIAKNQAGSSLSKPLYELGLSYTEDKDFPKAATTFDRLIKEFPSLENADKILYELAWAQKEQNLPKESSVSFAKLVEQFPQSPLAAEANYHLGQLAYDDGDYAKSIGLYSKALAATDDRELLEKLNYKLGWSYFQQNDYARSAAQFAKQTTMGSDSSLAIEGIFMQAESLMKSEKFAEAFDIYKVARKRLESSKKTEMPSDQVQSLIYLHGAQTARELKRWNDVDEWLKITMERFPESPFIPFARYEQAFSAQSTGRTDVAVEIYQSIADSRRDEIGARSRFMIGEIYFAQKDFGKSVAEFEKVIYGFGAKQAPDEVKNWQARAAFEAGRCTEVLVANLTGPQRSKAIQTATKFYREVADGYPKHELVGQAETRIAALQKLER